MSEEYADVCAQVFTSVRNIDDSVPSYVSLLKEIKKRNKVNTLDDGLIRSRLNDLIRCGYITKEADGLDSIYSLTALGMEYLKKSRLRY